jgi:multiple sugar transport system permease protein
VSARIRSSLFPYAIAVPFAVVLAFPFAWMVLTSLKRQDQIFDPKHMWRFKATTEGWRFLLHDTQYMTWVKNTAVIGGLVVVITLVLALPAGYALARLSGRFGQGMGVAIFLTYLVPPTLLFLPLSRVITKIGLQDSIWSLVLVYPSFTVPFSVWLLMGFFKTIPRELEDAALIDGCSRLKAIYRVVFPISLPGILTVVIFSFSLVVNEYIYAITFISRSAHRTISAGVPTDLVRGDLYNWPSIMASILIPSIPLALIYNAFLNRFITGFTGGAFR